MNPKPISKAHVMDEVSRVFDAGELELALQPIVNLGSEKVLGHEVLSRLKNSLYTPEEVFTHLDEGNPLFAIALGESCIEKAIEKAPPGAPLWLNLSVHQLMPEAQLLAYLDHIRSRKPLGEIVFEVTERLPVVDPHINTLRGASEMGVGLALDDFGAGYCNWERLEALGPYCRYLKLSADFFQEGVNSPVVIESAVNLAALKDMEVVAEGIEHEEHLQVARAAGCQFGQGYRLQEPVPIEVNTVALATSK